MNDRDWLEAVRGLRFCQDLPEPLLAAIARTASPVTFDAGAVLFREGQDHDTVYLVREGTVGLEVRVGDRTVRLQTAGPGELVGWTPLIGHGPMTATARAVGPAEVRAVAMSAPQLLAHFEQEPRLGMAFLRRAAETLARRLAATRLQLLDIYRPELTAQAAGKET
jgi:CRP/FNR family transcriptional regulator